MEHPQPSRRLGNQHAVAIGQKRDVPGAIQPGGKRPQRGFDAVFREGIRRAVVRWENTRPACRCRKPWSCRVCRMESLGAAKTERVAAPTQLKNTASHFTSISLPASLGILSDHTPQNVGSQYGIRP